MNKTNRSKTNRAELIAYLASLIECARGNAFTGDCNDQELLSEVYFEAVYAARTYPDVQRRAVAAFQAAGWPVRI